MLSRLKDALPQTRAARTTILCALTLGALMTTAACTPPQVSVRDTVLQKLTIQGLAARIDLSIFNPNTYAVPLRSVEWKLDLFRSTFSQGKVPFSRQIGAQRRDAIPVPLSVQFRKVALGVNKLLQGQQIPWGVAGRCNFNTQIGPIFVQFNKAGTWNNPLRGMNINMPRFGENDLQRHEQGHEQHATLQLPATPFTIHLPTVAASTLEP